MIIPALSVRMPFEMAPGAGRRCGYASLHAFIGGGARLWCKGFSRARKAGNKVAGPVGGVLGGAIGGVVGVVTGVLGVGSSAPAPAANETKPPSAKKAARTGKATGKGGKATRSKRC